MNDLIAQGVVEKLYVPNPNSRLKKKSWVQCLRLQTADKSQSGEVEGATSQIPGEAATNEVDAEELYGMSWMLYHVCAYIDLSRWKGTTPVASKLT